MKFKTIIPLLVSIIIFLAALLLYLINKTPSDNMTFTKFDDYEIKIDVPTTEYELIENEIQEFIQSEKENFFYNIDITLDVNTSFEIYYNTTFNGDVEILTLYSKIKVGNLYKNNTKTIHYSLKENRILTINDYLLDETKLLSLSQISYFAIMEKINQQGITLEKDTLEKIISPISNNYKNFQLTDEGLQLLFILDQQEYLEIPILLPYAQINSLLKAEYRKNVIAPYKRDLSQFAGKKLIAFTFDDGPNSITTEILLNGLNKYNAKVTFFVLGNKANANSATLKRAYEEGNQIGSHTYNHKNLIKLNASQIKGEINNTSSVIQNIVGAEPLTLRPPYGNANLLVRQNVKGPIILWSIDPLDWKYKDKEIVKNNIVKEAKDGDIVLVHDIYLSSVEGALLAMEELYNQGFAFVTIDEMMQLKGINGEQGKYYYKF